MHGRRKPIALDLFAGAGGLSEGLRSAGWDIPVAVEKDKDAAATYLLNHNCDEGVGTKVLTQPIESISFRDLKNTVDEIRGIDSEIDLIAGGPPCQGFSIIGARNLEDERNKLFLEFIRTVAFLKPKAFIAENVRGILSFAGRRMPILLERVFDSVGYNLAIVAVNTVDFGVPQDRIRVLFLGLRKDLAQKKGIIKLRAPAACFPKSLRDFYEIGKPLNVWEAISDLPLGEPLVQEKRIWVGNEVLAIEDTERVFAYPSNVKPTFFQSEMRLDSYGVFNNHTKGISRDRMDKIKIIPEGGTLSSPGRSNAWRRLSWNKSAHTLQAHMGKDLKEFIHPEIDRWITVREAARIQTFCDKYRFVGSQSSQLKQVGNAVAPFMGWAVGAAIGSQLGFQDFENIPLRELKSELYNSSLFDGPQVSKLISALPGAKTELDLMDNLNKIYDLMINMTKQEKQNEK